jgi:hypothetical protein
LARRTTAKKAEETELITIQSIVWVCMYVAVAATLYYLMKEPEDAAPAVVDPRMGFARLAALVVSIAGALLGVARVLSRGAGPGLFGMAVLFNVIIGCFWILRFALAP